MKSRREYHAAWRAANPEKMKAKYAAYRAANPEKLKARHAAYCAANPEKVRARQAARYAANPEKEKARNAAWCVANKEKKKAYMAAYHVANREKHHARSAAIWASGKPRMQKYGLSPEAFQLTLLKQQNACGICKETFSEKQPPHVDHCHISGKVRGLLCGNCNRGLGIFRDSLGILENAKEYLKENS